MTTRDDCLALDACDPRAPLRRQFMLPDGVIYLDGNSLGPLPTATPVRVAEVVRDEWGVGLIKSWNSASWIHLPQRVGDKIARLIGAKPGEVAAADSTSVNLYKVLTVALALAGERRVVVSERSNFPTDLYIAEELLRARGGELVLLEHNQIVARVRQGDVAVLMLTQVNYRTGRLLDMAALTAAAHAHGALTVWDLAHTAGALPVDLHASDADFAIGCGYKYLNGGPGAPAFVWVHPRHVNRRPQPLAGWMGHASGFDFTPGYVPANGITRYLCGTPPVIGMAALECGVDTLLAAEPLGGMTALRTKSLALTDLFVQLVHERCAGHGLANITPLPHTERGSQVCLTRAEGAYPIVQALIARGVIGDFRAPDVLRFGFAPLYLRHIDAWDAVEHLRQLLESGEWKEARFNQRAAVT